MRLDRRLLAMLLVSACAGRPPASPAPAAPSSPSPLVSKPNEAMWHHFWDVAVARDAVIEGDIDGARARLSRVARSDEPEPLPPDWLPWMSEMRSEAAKAAGIETLSEMAAVVSAVSAQCADCHRATRGGPELALQTDNLDYGHPDRGFSDAMKRHAWAADELWLGMTIPSYSSWIRGARALGEFPVPGLEAWDAARRTVEAESADSRSAQKQEVDPAMVEKLRNVRALGQRAEAAGKPFEQQAIFAELIALCGDCHRALPPESTVTGPRAAASSIVRAGSARP